MIKERKEKGKMEGQGKFKVRIEKKIRKVERGKIEKKGRRVGKDGKLKIKEELGEEK